MKSLKSRLFRKSAPLCLTIAGAVAGIGTAFAVQDPNADLGGVVPDIAFDGFDLDGKDVHVEIDEDGTIIDYTSPAGFDHIGVGTVGEGYVVCYTPPGNPEQNRFDLGPSGGQSAGWSISLSDPDLNFYERSTSDGRVRLSQIFDIDEARRAIKVTMTLRNIATPGSNLHNVRLRRVVDFDVDQSVTGSFDNRHGNDSKDSVFAWNHPGDFGAIEVHQMSLNHTQGTSNRNAKVTEIFLDSSCNPAALGAAAAFGPGDFTETLQYNFGTLGPGQARTVIVEYRRS